MSLFDLVVVLSAILLKTEAEEVTEKTNITASFCNINNSLTLKDLKLPDCGSCRNKCGQEKTSEICACDSLCMYYDDCCPDIEYHCLNEYRAAKEHLEKYSTGLAAEPVCNSFTYTFSNINYLVYIGYKIVNSCANDLNACTVSPHKPETLIPVYDITSKMHFVTKDCALCNRAYNLKAWSVSVLCYEYMGGGPGMSKNESTSRTDGTHIFHALLNGSMTPDTEGCTINIEPPIRETSLRPCHTNLDVITNCPDECKPDLVDNACKNVGLQPFLFGPFIFKNYYCALCNVKDPRNKGICDLINVPFRGQSGESGPDGWSYGKKMFVVFDFFKSNEETNGDKKPTCADGQIWYRDKCRTRNNPRLLKPKATYLQRPNCSFIEFNPEEVNSTFNNSYIVLKPTDGVIKKPYFYIGENGSFFICLNQSNSTRTGSSKNLLTFVFYILCSMLLLVSIIALIFRVIVQCLIRELWQGAGWVQTSLAMAMLLSQIFHLTMPYIPSEHKELCKTVAVIMHWAFLAMFCWMSVLSIDTCKMLLLSLKLQKVEQSKRCRFFAYSIIGWGLPCLVVILSLGLNYSEIPVKYRPQYGAKIVCWLSQRHALILYFIVPVALSLLVNTIAFTISCTVLCKMSSGSRATGRKRYNTLLYLKLFLLMGVSWLTSIFAELADIKVLQYLSFLFNAAQGFLLVLGIMCTPSTRSAILAKCPFLRCRAEPQQKKGISSATATTSL